MFEMGEVSMTSEDSSVHFRKVISEMRIRIASLDEEIQAAEHQIKANRLAANDMRRGIDWLERRAPWPPNSSADVTFLTELPIAEACVAVLRKFGAPPQPAAKSPQR